MITLSFFFVFLKKKYMTTSVQPEKLLDTTLYAMGKVPFYNYVNGQIMYYAYKGNNIGSVYSYVISGGKLWWMIRTKDGFAYVPHSENVRSYAIDSANEKGLIIDNDTYQQVGSELDQEKNKEPSSVSRIWDFVVKYGGWLILGFGLIYLIKSVSVLIFNIKKGR